MRNEPNPNTRHRGDSAAGDRAGDRATGDRATGESDVGAGSQPGGAVGSGRGAAIDLAEAAYELAVFEGLCPEPGALAHACSPLWYLRADGSHAPSLEILNGKIGPHDRCVPLDAAVGADQAWILIRRRDPGGTQRVLVVEDNPVNLEFYSEVLARTGLEVSGADSGARALQLIEQQRFDLVITDIRLPDTNGFELCRAVLRLEFVDLPVLLMSADPGYADGERVVGAGALGFIANPVSPATLAERVKATLHETTSELSAPVGQAAPEVPANRPTLRLLGEPALLVDGTEISLPRGRSAELVATLAVDCPTSVSPERLARFVWAPESSISSNAVYTAMSRLRSFLAEAGLPDLVATEGTGYVLHMTAEDVDLSIFEASARAVLARPELVEADEIRQLIDSWSERPFADSHNALLVRWGLRLSEARARLLEALTHHYMQQGDYAGCEQTCAELLATEPWRERIWVLRIVSLYLLGRTEDALRAFATARARLRDELGLEPGEALMNTEVMLLSHDPRLRDQKWLNSLAVRA